MKFIYRAILACLMLVAPPTMAAYDPVTLTLLEPTPIDRQMLEDDGAGAIHALAPDGAIWVLGHTHLWRWYPLTRVTQRVSLKDALPTQGRAAVMHQFGRSLLVVAGSALWRIDLKTFTVESFARDWSQQCMTPKFLSLKEEVFVFNSCGVYKINIQERRAVLLEAPPVVARFENVVFVPQYDYLVGSVGKILHRLSWSQGKFTIQEVYEVKAGVSGIGYMDGYVLSWTDKALSVFDSKTFKRVQVVPNVGQSTLIDFAFSPELHVAWFADGLVEMMSPVTQKKWTARIDVSESARLQMDPAGAFAIVNIKGFPLVLGFENLSRAK